MNATEYTTSLDSIIPMLLAEAAAKPSAAEKINAGIDAWVAIKAHGFEVSDMPGLPNEKFGPITGGVYFMLALSLRKASVWILR
jgi:hypothetical protein